MKNNEAKFCAHCGNELSDKTTKNMIDDIMEQLQELQGEKEPDSDVDDKSKGKKSSNK